MNSVNMQGFNAELQAGLLEKIAHELAPEARIERVKEKVRAKYPDMLKGKEKDSMGNFGTGNGALPGMVGGPPGGQGMQQMNAAANLPGRMG